MTTARDLRRNLEKPTSFYLYENVIDNQHRFISDLYLNGQVIILVMVGKNFGHWCCVKADFDSKVIYYFSSFGTIPDYDKEEYVPVSTNDKFRQRMNALSKILKNYFMLDLGFDVRYNHIRYQNPTDPTDRNCGKWCVLFLNFDGDEITFHKIILKHCLSAHLSYKEFIESIEWK